MEGRRSTRLASFIICLLHGKAGNQSVMEGEADGKIQDALRAGSERAIRH